MSAVHLQRCWRHPEREAAARCPACRRYYCRECVVEHQGRLLCSACLAVASRRVERRVPWYAWTGLPLQWLFGLLVAWLLFGALGQVLTDIPDSFHEGTYWQFLKEETP